MGLDDLDSLLVAVALGVVLGLVHLVTQSVLGGGGTVTMFVSIHRLRI